MSKYALQKSRAGFKTFNPDDTRGTCNAAAESTGPSFLLWVSNGPVKTLEMCYSDVRTTANQHHASCATIAGSSSSSSCSLLHLESKLLSRERKIDMRRTLVPRWTHMSNQFCACERFWGLKPQLVQWDSKQWTTFSPTFSGGLASEATEAKRHPG